MTKFKTRLNLSNGNFIQQPTDLLTLSGRTVYVAPITASTIQFKQINANNNAIDIRNGSNNTILSLDYRTNGRLSFGLSHTVTGNTAIAIGESNIATGYVSSAFGFTTIASGDYSYSQNQYTIASGIASHAGGRGIATRPIIALGIAAFNHSNNTIAQISGHGANATNSVILGGQDHNISSGNTRAAIIGGSSIKLTGTSYIDYAAVSNLVIYSTPPAGGSEDILTWNPSSRKVNKITQASISGVLTANNGLTKTGSNTYLGGTLTGATTISATSANTLTFRMDNLGANTSGFALLNNTAASAVLQQSSPSIVWEGQGWKTNATAGSQNVRFRQRTVPVVGTANPTGSLLVETSVNNAAYTTVASFTSAGGLSVTNNIASQSGSVSVGGGNLNSPGGGGLGISNAGAGSMFFQGSDSSGGGNLGFGSLGSISFANGTTPSGASPDVSISRSGVGVLQINTNTGAAKNGLGRLVMGGTSITNASSLLDLQSTGRTLTLTRIGTEGNIASPVNGQIYYNSTLNRFRGYANNGWVDVNSPITGVTNGLRLTNLGKQIALGGNLTGNTQINTTGSTKMFELKGNGNIVIGNATGGNTRLHVRGGGITTGSTALFQDSIGGTKLQLIDEGRVGFNTTAGSGAFYKFRTLSTVDNDIATFVNSGNTTLLSVGRVGGQLSWQTSTSIYSSTNDGTVTPNGNGLIFATNAAFPNFTSNFYFVGAGGNNTIAGTRKLMRLGTGGSSWNPASGTSEFVNLLIDSTYNAGSTYTGKAIGIDYAPTVALGAGQNIGMRLQSGSILIGATTLATPNPKLQVRGGGTVTGTTALFEDSSATARFTLQDNGMAVFNIGSQIFAVRTGPTTNSIRLSTAGSIFYGSTAGALIGAGNSGVQAIGGTGLVYRGDGGHSWNMGNNYPAITLGSFSGYSFTNGIRSSSGTQTGTGWAFLNDLRTTGGTPTVIGLDYNSIGSLGAATEIGLRVQKGSTLLGYTTLANKTTRLQVRGYGTTSGTTALFQDNAGTSRLQILDSGVGTVNGNWAWNSGSVFVGVTTGSTSTKLLVRASGNTSSASAGRFVNSAGNLILNIRGDQMLEIGGTSFLIEVPSDVADGDALISLNNNKISGLDIEDKAGNPYMSVKTSTSDKSVILQQKVEHNFGVGFTSITRQGSFTTTTTAAAQNIVLSIPVSSGMTIMGSINIMDASTSGGRKISAAPVSFTGINIAGTMTGVTSTVNTLRLTATTGAWNVNFNNTTKSVDVRLLNETGTGFEYNAVVELTYVLRLY